MKSEVSPGIAAVIIVIIVAVVGFFIWSRTSTGGRKELPPEAKAKMQQMLGASGPGVPNGMRPRMGGQ